MAHPYDEENLVRVIKDLERRVRVLETELTIRNLTIPTDGSIQVPQKAGDPSGSTNGQLYYNTGTNKLKVYENGSWTNVI
jgi:hypothetical protein